ncbi:MULTISPECIES: post-transcriptional regulator [Bacillaceae]|uniref:Competence protein ComN n=1 Tax=Domibacillus aminovorans TaxID=29332 RepID=A0A177LBW4_9BACI|nr:MULTISPECIES: post-transcriptional regulator [Bacillaceae]OAH56113.1 competence protein ComN [Domibacillus aminovorans]OAH62752.1 competence protein ComN [Domibacillus aminovorans]
MDKHPYDTYYRKLLPALVSKVEEFKLFEYHTVSIQTLWHYLTKKKWKVVQEEPAVSKLVSDVLSVKPGDYMSFTQVSAYKSPEWGTPLSDEEMTKLFEPRKNSE